METMRAASEFLGGVRAELSRYVQFEPVRAMRAAKILSEDPNDLPQVFTIIESLSMATTWWTAKWMERSERGRRLLSERPDIVNLLADREALRRLPDGSLGRAYLDFVESENISAEGIREASHNGMQHTEELPVSLAYVHTRMRDTHDLWHAATGYKGGVLGESALLAFSLTHTWNPGVALIIGIALLKSFEGKLGDGGEARRTILDGFRRGLRAEYMVDQEWESLLALPVEEVRQRLRLEAPPVYDEVRASELQGMQPSAA